MPLTVYITLGGFKSGAEMLAGRLETQNPRQTYGVGRRAQNRSLRLTAATHRAILSS
jgi:hypothetical protein